MRRLSCAPHGALIGVEHDLEMRFDDPVLPAATELTSDRAIEALRPVVERSGGQLGRARCAQVHYVPGRELVARYDCDVDWGAGPMSDTLLAATIEHGHLPGTVPVTAATRGGVLEVGVWRWPFDPIVTGLPIATRPSALAECLDGVLAPGPPDIEVVAYRPTERAVLRVTDSTGAVGFLKVLPPGRVGPIARRHEAVIRAGVRAPGVLLADDAKGLLFLEALPGTTLRDRIKAGDGTWPAPGAVADLCARLAAVGDGVAMEPGRASRTLDAIGHAQLIETIAPELGEHTRSLIGIFERSRTAVEERSGSVVHGDLHEAQIFVGDDGNLTGIIDLDDLGPGDPLDDAAVLLGHLEYRVLAGNAPTAQALRPRIDALHRHFETIHETPALHRTIAAVLVGLATGPFRAQAPTWRTLTSAVLDGALRHVAAASARPLARG